MEAETDAADENSTEDVIVGKHVYGNLYGIERKILEDEEFLKRTVLEAVARSNMTLIEIKSWRIGGKKGGVSVIALVNESHIALHTWVEYSYATLDVYTCGEHSDPWKGFNYIIERLRPKFHTAHYIDRTQSKELKSFLKT